MRLPFVRRCVHSYSRDAHCNGVSRHGKEFCPGSAARRPYGLYLSLEREVLRGLPILALQSLAFTIAITMSFFKKSKKSRQPSRQPVSLGIPTQIALGALGISADLDRGVGPGGAFRSVKARSSGRVDLTITPRRKQRKRLQDCTSKCQCVGCFDSGS